MEAYYCYILFSNRLNRFYIGHTENGIEKRIEQHNSAFYGANKYTAKANDWSLFLAIDCKTRQQAEAIERHIKRMKSTKYIQNLKVYPELQAALLAKHQH